MMPRVRRAVIAVMVLAGAIGPLGALDSTPADAGRTFGDDPLDAVLAAAAEHKACGLSRDKLAALMLAPTFRESGAPTTEAPSPMTLSRWDTQSALYSFGNKTSYPEAFWHPGISPWQYDDAGLWGLTAAQRIDTAFIADHTAEYMVDSWCRSPSFETVWAPWFACNGGACTEVYNEIYKNGKLVNVTRAGGVTNYGGMRKRTCSNGGSATFTCWYVDPALAEGYRGFAVPGAGPAPITAPFYVYSSGGKEHRHWLRAHTGYGIDIQASLPLGTNSRTSLTWQQGSNLCDISAGIGLCDPLAPAGFRLQTRTVNGGYQPFSGDFNGDGRDDIFWYGPGNKTDSIWYGTANASFSGAATKVNGTYEPVVGDFDGDGRDDILWYGSGSAKDSLWRGRGGGFQPEPIQVNGVYRPVAGDFTRDGRDDIFWYGPGGKRDSLWFGRSGGFTLGSVKVSGHYEPLVANYDGQKGDDVLWYGSGSAKDSLWLSDGDGTFTPKSISVSGEYTPVAGDFSGNGYADVLWYGEGSDPDRIWYGKGGGTFVTRPASAKFVYIPIAGDFDDKGGVDVFWYRPGRDYDAIWYAT